MPIMFVLAFFRSNPWAKWASAAVLALIIVLIVLHQVREKGRNDIRKENEAAISAAKLEGAEARGQAATERAADLSTVAAQSEERSRANENQPDGRPSDRVVRRRCVQLRQQGRDTSGIPECVGGVATPKATPIH